MAVVVDDLGWLGGLAGVRGTKKMHASLYCCTVTIRWGKCRRNGQYRESAVSGVTMRYLRDIWCIWGGFVVFLAVTRTRWREGMTGLGGRYRRHARVVEVGFLVEVGKASSGLLMGRSEVSSEPNRVCIRV